MEETKTSDVTENSDTHETSSVLLLNNACQNKKYIMSVVAVIIIIMSIVAGVSCIKNSSVYLYSLIDKGKVEKIVDLYHSSYSSNYQKEEKFVTKIDSYAEQKYEEYISDTISYSQVMQKYNTINEAYSQIAIANVGIGQYTIWVETARKQKEQYQKGISYLEQKEYKEAIEEFEKLLKEAKHYPGAVEKLEEAKTGYKQYVLTEAEALLAKTSYGEAIKILETGMNYFTNDSELSVKLLEVKNTVAEKAVSDAESDFLNSGYEKAIADIERAIAIVGDNTKLSIELDKYKAYVPVNIYDMECSERSRKGISRAESEKDNTNSVHKNVLYAFHKGVGDENPYEVYPLMGKYDTLTFEAYRKIDDGIKTADNIVKINIYGDNEVLKKVVIDENFSPQTYSLDISGVQKLKIEIESGWTDASQWFYSLPGAIANVVVAKTK